MNAHNHAFTVSAPNWYSKSGIVPCATCDGAGSYWNGRGMGGNDPDSWDIDCADCEGQGHFACQTCGFDVPVAGYDCLACSTIYELSLAELAAIDPAELAEAFGHAIAAAKETV